MSSCDVLDAVARCKDSFCLLFQVLLTTASAAPGIPGGDGRVSSRQLCTPASGYIPWLMDCTARVARSPEPIEDMVLLVCKTLSSVLALGFPRDLYPALVLPVRRRPLDEATMLTLRLSSKSQHTTVAAPPDTVAVLDVLLLFMKHYTSIEAVQTACLALVHSILLAVHPRSSSTGLRAVLPGVDVTCFKARTSDLATALAHAIHAFAATRSVLIASSNCVGVCQ
jgi:hypothetical protein